MLDVTDASEKVHPVWPCRKRTIGACIRPLWTPCCKIAFGCGACSYYNADAIFYPSLSVKCRFVRVVVKSCKSSLVSFFSLLQGNKDFIILGLVAGCTNKTNKN